MKASMLHAVRPVDRYAVVYRAAFTLMKVGHCEEALSMMLLPVNHLQFLTSPKVIVFILGLQLSH